MKRIALVVAAMLCSASMALAGDLAVDDVTLESMGLREMQPLSERDGLAIRGKGPLNFVFGQGFVSRLEFSKTPNNPGFSGDKIPSSPLGQSKGGFRDFGPSMEGTMADFSRFPALF